MLHKPKYAGVLIQACSRPSKILAIVLFGLPKNNYKACECFGIRLMDWKKLIRH